MVPARRNRSPASRSVSERTVLVRAYCFFESYARSHSNWIVPGKGIKTNIQVLQKLRERKIKGQLWRLLH